LSLMKTKAVRIYGKNDLRLDEFELPPIKDSEILARVISDSICMSSYKAAKQGADHKRIPDDIYIHPTIIGHEFAGELIQIGKKWRNQFKSGDKFSIQPALNYKGSLDAPGYSFRYIGGDATYIIIPNEVMEMNCLLPYSGKDFFLASLSEPLSCIIGAFHASYHTTYGSYIHSMGIREGGKMALLAGVGPMGLGSIDYAIHCDRKPGLLVVTDIDDERLKRAARVHTIEDARRNGVDLRYVNTLHMTDPSSHLRDITGGTGYDDVFVFAPVRQVVEQADRILGFNGCLNFFAGPEDPNFSALFNFYNVHYAFTHIVGTSGGNTDDMKEALELMSAGRINPAVMVTHIGGLDAVIDTTMRLPEIPGGKKLIYTNISMELTAIEDFARKGKSDPFFIQLDSIVKNNGGIWCREAEDFIMKHGTPI
jgi:threonine dehydrogenase-like Zn-dependent dehydrogenase